MKHMFTKLPKSLDFETLYDFMFQEGEGEIGVGNNTVALITSQEEPAVAIQLHETVVAVLHNSGDSVRLFSGGWHTATTTDRMDRCLLPLDFRMSLVRKTMKVYSIKTGAYRDFFDGMYVTRGEF